MATAVLFVYSTAGKEKREIVKISRSLFGYRDKSKRGKYTYNRKGILGQISYAKPARCCIIVGEKDSKRMEDFFGDKKIEFRKFKIILSGKEIGSLLG